MAPFQTFAGTPWDNARRTFLGDPLKRAGAADFSLVDPGPRHFFAPAKRASHCFQYVFQVSFECFFFS